jgi:hypothetical protein
MLARGGTHSLAADVGPVSVVITARPPVRVSSRTVRIDWREALTYVTREPAWKQRLGVGGLLMLVLPPLGWMLALGYRSLVGNRLVDGVSPLLPSWNGNFGLALRRGSASSGVIVVYLAPFLIGYWLLGIRNPRALIDHWRDLVTFVASIVAFPPLAIPALPILYATWFDWLEFTAGEVAVLVILALTPILMLPAAFLQVARHRRFRAAFNVFAALRFVASTPRLYAEAWIASLAVSAVAVVIVPITPWLLFWSYLVISHLFLQAACFATIQRKSTTAGA